MASQKGYHILNSDDYFQPAYFLINWLPIDYCQTLYFLLQKQEFIMKIIFVYGLSIAIATMVYVTAVIYIAQ